MSRTYFFAVLSKLRSLLLKTFVVGVRVQQKYQHEAISGRGPLQTSTKGSGSSKSGSSQASGSLQGSFPAKGDFGDGASLSPTLLAAVSRELDRNEPWSAFEAMRGRPIVYNSSLTFSSSLRAFVAHTTGCMARKAPRRIGIRPSSRRQQLHGGMHARCFAPGTGGSRHRYFSARCKSCYIWNDGPPPPS